MKKIFVGILFALVACATNASAQAIRQGTTSSAGDAGSNIPLCRASAAAETINTEDKYGFCSVDLEGVLRTSASLSWSGSSTDPSKLEDAAHVTGDRGMYMLGVIQDTLASSAADNDYGSVKQDSVGATWVRQRGTVAEDAQLTDGLITPAIGIKRTDTAAASANAADDNMFATGDGRGLLYVNPWGANHTEWFKFCSSAITTATTTSIVTATASKYHYVTAVNCVNNHATVNSLITLVHDADGTPAAVWYFNVAAVVGSDGMQFNPPLKMAATNQDVGVTTSGAANVYCCIEGFDSAT